MCVFQADRCNDCRLHGRRLRRAAARTRFDGLSSSMSGLSMDEVSQRAYSRPSRITAEMLTCGPVNVRSGRIRGRTPPPRDALVLLLPRAETFRGRALSSVAREDDFACKAPFFASALAARALAGIASGHLIRGGYSTQCSRLDLGLEIMAKAQQQRAQLRLRCPRK